jgi:hypothetical protein
MFLKQRAHYSRLVHNQRKDGNLPGFIVNCQMKAVGKQCLQHQPHLVFGGISLHLSLYVEPVGSGPLGQLREQRLLLILSDLVCKDDVRK